MSMRISHVTTSTPVQKGKRYGTVAGLTVSGAYVAKNAKSTFTQAAQNGLEKLGSKNKGIAFAVLTTAGIIGVVTGVGRLAGAIVGKIVESCKKEHTLKHYMDLSTESIAEKKPGKVCSTTA